MSRFAAPDRGRALAAYASLAEGYDASCSRIEGIRRDAIDLLALQPGDTVFDVACGTGWTLVELARRVGASGQAVGIEQCPEMAAQARQKVKASGFEGRVTVVEAPVEDASLAHEADAVLFCYTHDVLQNPAALENLFRRVKPGARVAVAGLRLRSWWWGWPLNAVTLWRTRNYLTTFRGLACPWAGIALRCPDFRVIRGYHVGTSYLGFGTLGPPASKNGER